MQGDMAHGRKGLHGKRDPGTCGLRVARNEDWIHHATGVTKGRLAKAEEHTARPLMKPFQAEPIQHLDKHLFKNGRLDIVNGRLRSAPPEHEGRASGNAHEIEKPESDPEIPVLADPLQIASPA